MVAVSAGSGPSAASALSVETAASVNGDQCTSPAQCAPSAPFHCAAEPSLQTVAPAHSIDMASSAFCTGPAVATLSLEAVGAATAKTAPAAKAVDADPVFLHLQGNLYQWRMLLHPSIPRETVN